MKHLTFFLDFRVGFIVKVVHQTHPEAVDERHGQQRVDLPHVFREPVQHAARRVVVEEPHRGAGHAAGTNMFHRLMNY